MKDDFATAARVFVEAKGMTITSLRHHYPESKLNAHRVRVSARRGGERFSFDVFLDDGGRVTHSGQ